MGLKSSKSVNFQLVTDTCFCKNQPNQPVLNSEALYSHRSTAHRTMFLSSGRTTFFLCVYGWLLLHGPLVHIQLPGTMLWMLVSI